MTEQQQHLKSAIDQQRSLASELNKLNEQTLLKKELFLKIQGVVEYLTQLGVTLPQESEDEEEVVEFPEQTESEG